MLPHKEVSIPNWSQMLAPSKFRRVFPCCTPPKDRSDWRKSFNFLVFGQNWRPRLILETAPVWQTADSLAEVLSGSARDRGMPGAQEELSFVSLEDRRPRFCRPGATSSEPSDPSAPIEDRRWRFVRARRCAGVSRSARGRG